MARVERKNDGRVLVTLPLSEAILLQSLPARLRALLENPDFTQRAVARLFPAAYADSQKDLEYRRLLGDDLQRRKLESVEVFERTLTDSKLWRGKVRLSIRPEEFDAWLSCVNDLRLTIGAELDIREETWSKHFDPKSPAAEEMALLHYLSWLEELLLEAHDPGLRAAAADEAKPEEP